MDEISWQYIYFLIVIINMARLRFIILALPLTMILHKILDFSEPWYPHLLNECNIISFTRVEGIERNHLCLYLSQIRPCSILLREGNGIPLQYPSLENPMDGGTRQAAVHEVAKSQAQLSDFTFTFHFHALEKEMATHSSVLAWRIPGTGEPGGLPSMGSHRVGHD